MMVDLMPSAFTKSETSNDASDAPVNWIKFLRFNRYYFK